MKHCQECKAEITERATFCKKCALKVRARSNPYFASRIREHEQRKSGPNQTVFSDRMTPL
jgi:predicted amidophosphoribosyltransferase